MRLPLSALPRAGDESACFRPHTHPIACMEPKGSYSEHWALVGLLWKVLTAVEAAYGAATGSRREAAITDTVSAI